MQTPVAVHEQAHAHPREGTQALLSVFASMSGGFGITLLVISLAYMRDLATLRQAPEAVWLFICGVPTDNPAISPLMLVLSVAGLLLAGVLMGVKWWVGRSSSASPELEE